MGRTTWRVRRPRGPRAPRPRPGRPLRETLQTPGRRRGGRPRGRPTLRLRAPVPTRGLGAPPPRGGASRALKFGGRAREGGSAFCLSGEGAAARAALRLRAGGRGGARREHLLRVNAGGGGRGGSVWRAEGRRRPSFKGLLGRAACTGCGGGGGGGDGWFPGPPLLKGRRSDPPLSKWFQVLSESPKVLVTPQKS